jgi:hypothetical protein
VVLLFVSLPLILKLEAFITIRAFESDNRMKSFLVIQVLSPAFKLQVTLSTMDSFSGSLLLPCFFCESVSPNMYVGFSLSFEHHFTFSTFFCCYLLLSLFLACPKGQLFESQYPSVLPFLPFSLFPWGRYLLYDFRDRDNSRTSHHKTRSH